MSPITAPFVIIMNADLERDLNQWSVVHMDKTLAAARLHTQYIAVSNTYPRDRYRAEILEVKNLVHTPSGVSKPGAIYRLSEVPARRGVLKTQARFLKTGKSANILPREIQVIDSIASKKGPKRSFRAVAPIIVKKKNKFGGKKLVAPITIRKVSKSSKKG